MEARKKTVAVLDKHLKTSGLGPRLKVAAGFDPEEQFKPKGAPGDNQVGSFLKRAIPKDFPYDPKALKPLAQTLWAMSVALGHTLTAHRQLSKVKSATVSPDGLFGGRGYVMSIKDVRKALYDAAEGLSAISDTLHDEINAPHWKPKLAELEKNDIESVERLVGEAEENLENPEEDADEAMEQAEESGTRAEMEEGEGEEEPASKIPDSGSAPDSYVAPGQVKQASEGSYDRRNFANSSVPVQTESGPRVQHLDRGDVDQTGPFGSYNNQEPRSTKDEWSREDGGGSEYIYQSEWDNNLLDETSRTAMKERIAASALPGKLTDPTPTEGYDFGIGYGDGNDAHGQGAGDYGTVDSDGKGVYGPHAKLPDAPGGTESDISTPAIELEVGRTAPRWKAASSKLPMDILPSVARSDYYEGDKGDNEVNAASSVPEVENVNYDHDKDIQPGAGYRHEQGHQPYIKWDSDTHNYEHDYIYQRDVEGPFERE